MSKESADIINDLFAQKPMKYTKFIELLEGKVTKRSFIKYRQGEPIHPKKARFLVEAIKEAFGKDIPPEALY